LSAFVLDASVAAKWFLPAAHETLVAESRQVLTRFASGAIQLAVPDLFWPELVNILWKAVRIGRLRIKSAEEIVRLLVSHLIPTWDSKPLLNEAFAVAVAFQRTVYDSIYLALAIHLNRTLLTADERLANALAAHFPVRWLGAL
jgi:predicted nucleic acid-binding protein